MTEQEWITCAEPTKMLEFVREKVSKRKWSLYMCGGCRYIAHLFFDPKSQMAVEVRERYADGQAGQDEMDRAAYYAESPTFGYHFEPTFWTSYPDEDRASLHRLVEMGALSSSALSGGEWRVNEAVRDKLLAAAHLAEGYCHLILESIPKVDWPGPSLCRCVFGNPFRPPSPLPPTVLAWNDSTVRRMAQGIYDDRSFDRLPILSDALLDAGCDDEELIGHCRSEGPHVRGCWAVDRILGKE
jgi:hypothetical protein